MTQIEADEFVREIEGFGVVVDLEKLLVLRYVVDAIRKALARNSPVDTGEYLSNWRGSVYGSPIEGPDSVSPDRGSALQRLILETSHAAIGGEVIFENVDPVALLLEYGWSDQAATGIVRMISRNYRALVRAAHSRAQADIKRFGPVSRLAGRDPVALADAIMP